MTEDHAERQHVTKNTHMEEDHVVGQHVTWNFNTENYANSRYVTRIITAEDHGDKHHMTDINAVLQQPGNSKSARELNLTDRQDHGMINIEELLNDWLGKAV